MDVLFTIAMLGLMAVAIVVLGRGWPRSSRGGGYRAGRGYGAGDAGAAVDPTPPVPEEDDTPWRWAREPAAPPAGDHDGQAPGDPAGNGDGPAPGDPAGPRP
jgi:hypothetical protein